jgi:hypothetical protein
MEGPNTSLSQVIEPESECVKAVRSSAGQDGAKRFRRRRHDPVSVGFVLGGISLGRLGPLSPLPVPTPTRSVW